MRVCGAKTKPSSRGGHSTGIVFSLVVVRLLGMARWLTATLQISAEQARLLLSVHHLAVRAENRCVSHCGSAPVFLTRSSSGRSMTRLISHTKHDTTATVQDPTERLPDRFSCRGCFYSLSRRCDGSQTCSATPSGREPPNWPPSRPVGGTERQR